MEKQFLSLYEEKVERAGELWSKVVVVLKENV